MVALLCMTTAFAMNEAAAPEATNVAAYNLNIDMNRLSDALNLTNDQKEAVENIYNMFNTEMSYATQYSSSEREIMVILILRKVNTMRLSQDMRLIRYRQPLEWRLLMN